MNIIYKAYICVCIITIMSILHVWYWNNVSVTCKGTHCFTTPNSEIENSDDATIKENKDYKSSLKEVSSYEDSDEIPFYEQYGLPQEAMPIISPHVSLSAEQHLQDYQQAQTVKPNEKTQTEISVTVPEAMTAQNAITQTQDYNEASEEFTHTSKPVNRNSYLIYEDGCKVPKFDAFDKGVRPYFKKRKNYQCQRPSIITAEGRTIHIDRSMLAKDLQADKSDIQCGLYAIKRKGEGHTDDEFLTNLISSNVNDSFTVSEEFVKVSCSIKRITVYTDFFALIHKKPQVEERCDKVVDTETKTSIHPKLNIVMVGLDSISSNNFRRHLPKSYQLIKAQLKAVELHGYIKLADNTFPCLTPMLTGKFVNELKLKVKDQPFDNTKFIWTDFSKKGYRTLFAEDYPEIAIFNYAKKGFFQQPTDYYLRPFYLAAEQSTMRMNSEEHCFNSRLEVSIVWQWLQDFMATFQDKPIFAMSFVTRLTHDFLNDAGYADRPFYEFLSSSMSKGYLNNTLLVLFSDHGIRFGSFRQTYIGQLEERHPFLFLVFPPWFKKQHPNLYQNVLSNEKKLVTMFDLHKTLKDILNLNWKEPAATTMEKRGISLFDRIPTERTCFLAGIQPQWCTCYNRQLVTSIDDEMMRAAHFLVASINKLTEGSREDCALLILHNVTSLYMSIVGPNQGAPPGQNAIDYFVIVETMPGKGLFEGTIWYDRNSNKFNLMGGISRVNRYRDQSWCVDDFLLKKLCYCNQRKEA